MKNLIFVFPLSLISSLLFGIIIGLSLKDSSISIKNYPNKIQIMDYDKTDSVKATILNDSTIIVKY